MTLREGEPLDPSTERQMLVALGVLSALGSGGSTASHAELIITRYT
jgi:hypothetical protein